MNIGKRLRELRLAAGLSQKEIAKQVGVSRNAVSQWEAGQTVPTTKRLRLLGQILETPIDQMIAPPVDVRGSIIAKAIRLFSELGYEEASVTIICASADIEKTEFDIHFKSKDELLYEACRELWRRRLDDLTRLPPVYGNIATRLKYFLRHLYVGDVAHVKMSSALLSYSWRWTKQQEIVFLRDQLVFQHAILSIFDEAAVAGEIVAGNHRAASDLVYSLYQIGFRKAVFDGYDPDHLVRYLEPQLLIVLAGLGFHPRVGFSEPAPH